MYRNCIESFSANTMDFIKLEYLILYNRKVWQEESLANSVLKRFGKEKFGEWHCELTIITT